MGTEPTITPEEKQYLRDLANEQLEYARLPIMEERKRRWHAHNALRGERPMLVMEMGTFRESVLPELRCTSTSPSAPLTRTSALSRTSRRSLIPNCPAASSISLESISLFRSSGTQA